MRNPVALARRVALSTVAVVLPCTLAAQQIVSYTPAPPGSPSAGEIAGVLSKTQLSPIYATMYGGNAYDELLAHVISRDIACMVGVTYSSDLTLFAPFQSMNAGGSDGWIGCGNISTGIPYLASYHGSTGDETITGADILADTLFVVGITTSETMPGTGGAYQDSLGGGGQDCFVTRMNVHDGSGLKTTLFGRDGSEYCSGISVNRGGVWVGGTTDKVIDLVNPLQSEVKGSTDAMAFMLSLDLNELLFSTLLGGDGGDGAERLAVSRVSDGDSTRSKFDAYSEVTLPKRVTLAGWSDDGGFPVTLDAHQSTHLGGYDVFYGSFLYDPAIGVATPEYFTYAGGGGNDVPRDLSFERGRAILTGWTTSANWNTIGRGRIDGSSDGFVYLDDCYSEVRNPIIAYVGPSSSYNLPLAVKRLPALGITVVGGYTAIPSTGNAFLQAYDRNFRSVGTEFSGGNAPADCNTIQLSADWWVCGGKTSGPIETTAMAIQSEFHGDFDMFGAKYRTPFSFSYLFNMTNDEITGKLNDYDLDPIAPRSPGRVDVLSWNLNYTYSLAGGGRTYQFDRVFDDLSPRISYSYLFTDKSLRVDAPEINHGETGILAYNELPRSVDIYRTDQTVEHNEIKRTTVDPGQFFFIPLPKDQNFGISDGADYIEFNPMRKHRNVIRYTAGFLQPKIGKGSSAQGFELVLFEADGDPIEFPVTTASEDPVEVPSSVILLANHPNPFQGTTTLRFELPEASPVRLVVYDIMGRRVRTLVDDLRSAGSTSVAWDGRNESGRPMASGTYLARLEVGGRFETKTMVLAR